MSVTVYHINSNLFGNKTTFVSQKIPFCLSSDSIFAWEPFDLLTSNEILFEVLNQVIHFFLHISKITVVLWWKDIFLTDLISTDHMNDFEGMG